MRCACCTDHQINMLNAFCRPPWHMVVVACFSKVEIYSCSWLRCPNGISSSWTSPMWELARPVLLRWLAMRDGNFKFVLSQYVPMCYPFLTWTYPCQCLLLTFVLVRRLRTTWTIPSFWTTSPRLLMTHQSLWSWRWAFAFVGVSHIQMVFWGPGQIS